MALLSAQEQIALADEERRRRQQQQQTQLAAALRPASAYTPAREAPAGPPPGLTSYIRAQQLPIQQDPADRQAATGETTLGWTMRRYNLAFDAGWDPARTPIPLLHDLVTMPVDDGTLNHLFTVAAPLQDQLTARLATRNQQRRLGLAPGAVMGEPGSSLSAARPPAPPDSIVGYGQRRAQAAQAQIGRAHV